MRRLALLAATALTLFASFADELEVASEALRDGLWQVARRHATPATNDTARLVVLESWASEGRWDEVRKFLSECADSKGAAFDYYRSAAEGDRLQAMAALKSGGDSRGVADAMMLEAGMKADIGDRAGAEAIWREVVARTNVGERAFAVAAANLGDTKRLREAFARVGQPSLRRFVGLRLGMTLTSAVDTREEGMALVRRLVKESPDDKWARPAFVSMAEAFACEGRWQEAAAVYAETLEIWPEAAKSAAIQEGRGWALLNLSKYQAAIEAFAVAENAAVDAEDKARAAVKIGDALLRMNRPDEAMTKYRQLLGAYPRVSFAEALATVLRVRELEERGRREYAEFRYDEAGRCFAEVAGLDASRRRKMEYFGMLCDYGRGFDDSAVAKARKLAECDDDDEVRADARLWLAKALYNRGEWKESGELFAAYVEMRPQSPSAVSALLWRARAALALNDFALVIQTVTRLVGEYPGSDAIDAALLLQGEALVEQTRFDEAVLVLERVIIDPKATAAERIRAQLLKADALFATGADDQSRYQLALDAYNAVRQGGDIDGSERLTLSFKIARTLEKLRRFDEAEDQYYTQVITAYRTGRLRGERFDDEATAAFSRAAFHLADGFEGRGRALQAVGVLRLVAESDAPAADEARRRILRIENEGRQP